MKIKIILVLTAVLILCVGCSAKNREDDATAVDAQASAEQSTTDAVTEDSSAFELEMIPFDFPEEAEGAADKTTTEVKQTKPTAAGTTTTKVAAKDTTKAVPDTGRETVTVTAASTSKATEKATTKATATTTKGATTTMPSGSVNIETTPGTTKAPSATTTTTAPSSAPAGTTTTRSESSTMPTMPGFSGGAFETPEIPI